MSGPVSNFTIDLPGEEVKIELEQEAATTQPISTVPIASRDLLMGPSSFPDPNAFSISNEVPANANLGSQTVLYNDNPYLSVAGTGDRMEGAGNAAYKTPAVPEYDDLFPELPPKLELTVKILLMILNAFLCLMYLCLIIYLGDDFSRNYNIFFIYFFSFIWYAFYIVVPLKIRNVQTFMVKHIPIMTNRWFMIFSPFIYLFTVRYCFHILDSLVAANAFRIMCWFIQITLMIIAFLYKFKFNNAKYGSTAPQVNHYESAEDTQMYH